MAAAFANREGWSLDLGGEGDTLAVASELEANLLVNGTYQRVGRAFFTKYSICSDTDATGLLQWVS